MDVPKLAPASACTAAFRRGWIWLPSLEQTQGAFGAGLSESEASSQTSDVSLLDALVSATTREEALKVGNSASQPPQSRPGPGAKQSGSCRRKAGCWPRGALRAPEPEPEAGLLGSPVERGGRRQPGCPLRSGQARPSEGQRGRSVFVTRSSVTSERPALVVSPESPGAFPHSRVGVDPRVRNSGQINREHTSCPRRPCHAPCTAVSRFCAFPFTMCPPPRETGTLRDERAPDQRG